MGVWKLRAGTMSDDLEDRVESAEAKAEEARRAAAEAKTEVERLPRLERQVAWLVRQVEKLKKFLGVE
jgi:ubiquinone biosynthesis protein UbiJ